MIATADTVPYESRPAACQELTFETLKQYFELAGEEFSEAKYRALGLVDEIGFFTHLAHWVSDQSEVETRAGFFSGTDKASPVNSILTFSGCLVDQYHKMLEVLLNRFGFSQAISAFSIRRDGTRDEVEEYPPDAVRAALANLFAHRDYSLENVLALASHFSDKLEFLSFGGLLRAGPPELLHEDRAAPRNRHLAALLVRLSARERHGLGIPQIYAAYKPFGLEPAILCDSTKLKIVLPRVTMHYEGLSEGEMQIVRFLRENGRQPRAKIQAALGRSYTYTIGLLTSLMKQGVVLKEGSGKSTAYRLK